MEHINGSKEAMDFFKDAGIEITKDSCHNVIVLKNAAGNVLTLTAESEYGLAAGIPGIYVENDETKLE